MKVGKNGENNPPRHKSDDDNDKKSSPILFDILQINFLAYLSSLAILRHVELFDEFFCFIWGLLFILNFLVFYHITHFNFWFFSFVSALDFYYILETWALFQFIQLARFDNLTLFHHYNVISFMKIANGMSYHDHSFSSPKFVDCFLHYKFAHLSVHATQNIIQQINIFI